MQIVAGNPSSELLDNASRAQLTDWLTDWLTDSLMLVDRRLPIADLARCAVAVHERCTQITAHFCDATCAHVHTSAATGMPTRLSVIVQLAESSPKSEIREHQVIARRFPRLETK